jgi:hypothetical protein
VVDTTATCSGRQTHFANSSRQERSRGRQAQGVTEKAGPGGSSSTWLMHDEDVDTMSPHHTCLDGEDMERFVATDSEASFESVAMG